MASISLISARQHSISFNQIRKSRFPSSQNVRRSARSMASSESTVENRPETTRVLLAGDSLDICQVVNGMWQVSSSAWGQYNPSAAVESMLEYVDNGFTTFDMADIYGPAEQLYGSLMNRARRERGEEYASKIQGLTKLCPRPGRMTRQVVEEAINRSRRNMDVSTLDMVQFHWWDYSIDGYLDALKHLTDLKEEGKITAISLTNFDTKRLQIILESGIPIATNQVQHSLIDMRPQQRMTDLCSLTGVRYITYGTLLGGLLSNRYVDAGEPGSWGGPRLSTPSQGKYKRMIDAWGGWKLFQELLRELRTIGRKYGVSISAVGLRAILDQPCVAGTLVGVRFGQSEHIKDTESVFKFKLDEEDWKRIGSVTSRAKNLLDVIGDCGDEYR